jgi:hypothetical protein
MGKDPRIAKAVGELAEAFEFVYDLSFDPVITIDRIREKYPEFINRFEAMENVDEEDFLNYFYSWVLNLRFREKYPDIWEEIKEAYNCSHTAKILDDKFLQRGYMKRQIEKIIRDSGFDEE